MVPAYLPNPTAALCGGGTPVDFGKTWTDNRRILGDGKTWRGLFFGIFAGIAVGFLEIGLSGTWHLDYLPTLTPSPVILLAAGALIGDMCKSFVKRRIGKNRGSQWPVADQYDLVAGAFVMLAVFDPTWLMANISLPVLLVILILTPILHRAVNILGYRIKVKEVPW
jgi:CDP-2,3-bis-(O-geranylgeranyl)-sn-glycerol synthase